MKLNLLLLTLTFFVLSCKNRANYVQLDLLSYEFPIKIDAPEDVDIEAEELLMYKGLSIKNSNKYDLTIYKSKKNQSIEETIQEQKELVQENPFFQEFVLEEPDGFIYRTVVDSTYENFNFRYVKIFGGFEYLFQAGLITHFSESDVLELYTISKKSK